MSKLPSRTNSQIIQAFTLARYVLIILMPNHFFE